MAMTRENSPETLVDDDGNEPVTLEEPMGSLYEVTKLRNLRSNKAKTTRAVAGHNGEIHDFISRGIISEEEAEDLYRMYVTYLPTPITEAKAHLKADYLMFDRFLNTLNHYLWVGLEQIHDSLISVRRSSELLTATILTVTALHLPNSTPTFDSCYKEFLSLISSSMFSRYHAVDDVRGLCIAAFWLSEVSWKLSGHAIRIATELNIHQSFSRALKGDRDHFLRARLWYMLYVCDHHFSIAYGRPPMISESVQIRELERFIAGPSPDILDIRILSQVHLMQILSSVYHRFSLSEFDDAQSSGVTEGRFNLDGSTGMDTATAVLAESDLDILSDYNSQIDQWRKRWYPRQPPSPYIGEFTNRGVVLYSYFAKLQINSLAVRGLSISHGKLSTERKELANVAVSAAISILTMVLEEEGIRKALVGTPLYVHTMIAFASVFLMKATTKWAVLMGLNIEYAFVSRLLAKIVTLLKTAVTSDRHLIKHIAVGLERLLGRLAASSQRDRTSSMNGANPEASQTPSIGLLPSWHPATTTGDVEMRAQGQHNFGSSVAVPLRQSSTNPATDVNGWTSGTPQAEDTMEGLALNTPTMLTNELMYQAFGGEPANNVYSLLSTQFQ